jgi:hypothetical protein
MNQTSLSTPSSLTTGVIPDNETVSGWKTYYGDAAPYVFSFSLFLFTIKTILN